MEHKKQSVAYDRTEILRESYLTPSEIFLLGFLKNFNRKKSQQLSEDLFLDNN